MIDTSCSRPHVLITGASTGIGRACALHLASLGFGVFAGVRTDADAQSFEREKNISAVHIDVTDADSIMAAVSQMKSRIGDEGLAGVVNNAGIGVFGPVEFIPLADWRRQFEVNVFGAIAVAQTMLPLLRDRVARAGTGSARLVNMSSIAGRIAQPIMGPYCASKFALESLSDSLRLELAPMGIHVCAIEPGAIDTPIWKKAHATESTVPLDHPARKLYGPLIDSALAVTSEAAAGALPPSAVARAVEAALTRRKPKPRYIVGRDAKLGSLARRLMPDRWFDRILRKVYGIADR